MTSNILHAGGETRKRKQKTIRKWTDRESIRFMEMYEAEEVLWNVRLADYKNKDARNSAVERLAKAMNIPGFSGRDVLKKINSMRTTYKQEIEKIKVSNTGTTDSATTDIYVPNLAWYKIADRFLRGVMNIRSKLTNLVSFSGLSF